MKIETYPLIVGAIVGLIGLLLLFDAWTPDETVVGRERRRAPRAERSRGGESAIGFGVLCLAAAILGRDSWRYSIVAAIAGAVLLLLGAILSRRYVKGRLVTYVDEPGMEISAAPRNPEREAQRASQRDAAGQTGPALGEAPSRGAVPGAGAAPATPPEAAPVKRLRIR